DVGGQQGQDRRNRVLAGMLAIRDYEASLSRLLLEGLAQRPKFKVWGITDSGRLGERGPTISVTHAERSPEEMARRLASRQIYTWNGNMYALGLTERLGLEASGGVLRLGMVHYNTAEEVDRLLAALDAM